MATSAIDRQGDGRAAVVRFGMSPRAIPGQLDPRRRAGVRRTVWIVAGMALAIYLLFFAQQLWWH